MMQRRYLQLALALPLTLGGCASGLPGLRPLTYATPGETRVLASGSSCIHDQPDATGHELAGVLAAVALGAASQLLTNFGTALSEGAKGGALPSSTATHNLQLRPGAIPKCLVIVRGSFAASAKEGTAVSWPSFLGGLSADQGARLTAMQLPTMFRVDHFIELRLDTSANNKALTFAPVYSRIDRSIDGARKGERDLSIAVKFNRAGADGVGSAVLLADRRIGTPSTFTREADTRFAHEAPWFGSFHATPTAGATGTDKPKAAKADGTAQPAPAAQPASTPQTADGPVGSGGAGAGGGATVGPNQQPSSAIVNMQETGGDAVPVTVTTTVVETRPTNEGLAFIASVFTAAKPKIDEALKPLIDSKARDTAEDAEATAALNAESEFSAADGAAQAAKIGYCEASSTESTAAGRQDRITKSQAARTAQIKVNVAAIKLGRTPPYTSLFTISADLPSVANAGPCA